MKKTLLAALVAAALLPATVAAGPLDSAAKAWTYNHANSNVAGLTSEIVAFDKLTNTLWVAGVKGVDVLNAKTGQLIKHIDTTMYGAINSVAIHNGVAAFAMESTVDRTSNGTIRLFNTTTLAPSSGVNSITVGALPDMIKFTADGSRLLVANEATPTVYGNPALDPRGSVSIINMATRSVIHTAEFAGAPTSGSHIRTNTGMDFEPEYIAVNKDGSKAYVALQEANAMGVIDLQTGTVTNVIGLGVKDFGQAGNWIDPNHKDNKIELRPTSVRGFYQPDGMVAYERLGQTYLVMANEGDTREDDGDKARASSIGVTGDRKELNISTLDSSANDLMTFGGRSFSIRDTAGNLLFDSGNELDAYAIALGIYDDGRSDDKGVEPEGVEIMEINGRVYAFIGLERTTTGAVAIYDITDPANASYINMLVLDGDLSPEGLFGFQMDGWHYLAIANEVSNTTSLYRLAEVPEPGSMALLLGGLGVMGMVRRRRQNLAA